MNTPPREKRKASKVGTKISPKELFLEMAYDLKVATDPNVIQAHAHLCAGRYMSFLTTLDTIGSQLYEPEPPANARALYQLAGFFSKYPFADPSIDRDKIAIEKFKKSEHRCKRMNQKFTLRRNRKEPPHMSFMRDWIRNVIGDSPNMSSIFSKCDFGPGSSIGVHGKQVDFLTKLDSLTVTPSAKPVAIPALLHNVHFLSYLVGGRLVCFDSSWLDEQLDSDWELVQYNKIVCVPKNAKTNRTIAIEPVLNSFIQKGIDLELRSKLYRFGIDLSRQSLNQALARRGSLYGSYATIDLSAASDSISIELVRSLLPPDWFWLLNSVRSPSYLYDGKTERYQKFCSMGNGFCFPLETLIFSAACAYAMSQCRISEMETFNVYGDDIVVPQQCALLLLEVLRDLGFRHNEDKTFIVGAFRESCGADFFLGENVRPLMVKEDLPLNHKVYYLLNQLKKRKLLGTWRKLFNSLPPRWRRHIRPYPRDDDTAIDVPLDVFMASKEAIWSRDLQTWTWSCVVSRSVPGRKVRDDIELLVGKLRGDLSHDMAHSTTFSARFSERTRVTRTC